MRAIAASLVVGLLAPTPAHAWGFEAHRFIMDRAIALLDAELRPLFEQHRAMLVERSVDPDSWRMAGFGEEPSNHFLDVDSPGYGQALSELPRDYSAAVEKFGADRIRQNGRLPWRIEEFFGNLRREFEDYREDRYGPFQLLFLAAALAHYTSDSFVPFHAVLNFDGQMSGQHGLHDRFEKTLFERYRSRLTISPTPMPAIRSPRDFTFDTLLHSAELSATVLAADAAAIGTGDAYDTAYYDLFFERTRPVLEAQLNDSIAAVAAIITGAWHAAGRPPVPLSVPEPVQRRRR
jgi:hypothetical protein